MNSWPSFKNSLQVDNSKEEKSVEKMPFTLGRFSATQCHSDLNSMEYDTVHLLAGNGQTYRYFEHYRNHGLLTVASDNELVLFRESKLSKLSICEIGILNFDKR